jgi:hypothetical protein
VHKPLILTRKPQPQRRFLVPIKTRGVAIPFRSDGYLVSNKTKNFDRLVGFGWFQLRIFARFSRWLLLYHSETWLKGLDGTLGDI